METHPIVALVPLRSPGTGKTRLAPRLSVEQRAALAGAMLADVCHTLARSPVDRLVVVAGGSSAVAAAAALGVDVLHDPPEVVGLDGALRAAAARVGRTAGLLVVTADLPCLTVPDVEAVVTSDAEVVVAPTADGGTGALLRRPPSAITTAYGRGSAARHLRLARDADLRALLVRRAGFAHDIDTWEDLRRLDRGRVGPATDAVLAQLALDDADVG
jgi:2-phospho-L-lactate/phosphoenolpyruvate guanylyltransferase